ncbi:FAD dependent oxidoreductase [Halteromyces radiatus]|uniref:FAD dependent oxidoreductase n=1 Tax=Halteromyces radiatus TaxID=101107 RepID=UPI0022208377|nr:FAD dependent oxidoreductase [Halteromyces radiatus]KAI8096614.1 FAD dependent oxidoreductase [Halteromyces radiatus]
MLLLKCFVPRASFPLLRYPLQDAGHRFFSMTRTPDLEVDNVVIGGGVVGLAIAEMLTRNRPQETTILVEKNKRLGEETSSRNSEVIHAGIYYPKDSLKTQLCIQGNRQLYALLEKTTIPYNKIGKWVVAQSPEQHEYLQQLSAKATSLGVETYFIDGEKAMSMEPELKAYSVLVSPTTGILDSHSFMDYLEQKIIDQGGDIALNTCIQHIRRGDNGGYYLKVEDESNNKITVWAQQRVFNAAGLHAHHLSNDLMPNKYKLYYARGHYYAYNAPSSIRHLIYPCPEKNLAGLGTHLTLDMANKIKFGPDVQYVDNPFDYSLPLENDHKMAFVRAIQSYLPNVNPDKLQPDYAGIRPKLAGPGEPFQDFIIKEEKEDGFDGFYSLIGIESPGLTSSLAIANYIHQLMEN